MRFAKESDFSQITSSPTYPQLNGLAKKAVHTAEQLLKKVKLEQRDPYMSLLEYRNISVDSLATPAQLLMSKHLRSIRPTTSNHLRPRVVHPDLARERMDKKTALKDITIIRELESWNSSQKQKRFISKQSQEIGSLLPFLANVAHRGLIPCLPVMEESIAGTDDTH